MTTPPRRPAPRLAGGPLIALGPLIGTAIGFAFGQATPGLLIGLAAGILGALALWWWRR